MFAAGAAIGSLATYLVLKPYYKRIMDEEARSIIEIFSARNDERREEPEQDCDDTADKKPAKRVRTEKDEYADIAKTYVGNKEVNDMDKPYVIAPEEFGERDGYGIETLNYYADGVLTYDTGEPVDDVEGMVGLGFETHYGKYKDDPDAVYVRNEKLETDYEILRDESKYSDLVNSNPHQAEDE
jgi:hypothetical protein